MKIHRGDIFFADLSSAVGDEMGGIRPVLIIQNDTLIDAIYNTELKEGTIGRGDEPPFNPQPETVIVAPITAASPGPEPKQAVQFPPGSMFVKVAVAQPRAISVNRLREFVEKASPEMMAEVDEKLKFVLGL